jgi:hypothetical protein
MFDLLNMPLVTDAGLKEIGQGAVAIGNIGNGGAALLNTHVAKAAVWGVIVFSGAWLAYKVWIELRSGAVKHEVLHRNEPSS